MMRTVRNVMLLILPFTLMAVINEMVRPTIKEKPYSAYGVTAMNTSLKFKDKCTWACHNTTNYCKQHHVTFDHRYFKLTDPVYFGVIHLLDSTGVYALANLVFLVLLIPLFLWYCLVKIIDTQIRINRIKHTA